MTTKKGRITRFKTVEWGCLVEILNKISSHENAIFEQRLKGDERLAVKQFGRKGVPDRRAGTNPTKARICLLSSQTLTLVI